MDKNTIISKLEALLFIYGEPIETKKLAKILDEKEADVTVGLEELEKELVRSERGLMLLKDKGNVQLVTKPEFSKLLEEITKQEFTEALTPAALETLSIIAYAGPITRADVEYIRGVNSSFTIRALLMRGLIEREVDPKRSNAYVYSTSFELLRHLGLSKNEDLPEYKKYKDLVSMLHHALDQKDQAAQVQEALPPADPESSPNENVQPNTPEPQS
jgi:segregation and condensation protein B